MCQLFETIKLQDGKLFNLEYHNYRMNLTRKNLFSSKNEIQLNEYLGKIFLPDRGLYKIKVIYKDKIINTEIEKYNFKKIESLKLIEDNEIDYSYKYVDRQNLNNLLSKKGKCSDILIIKNKLVTDTSYSNVIFFDGNKWFTPAHPLLSGTKRKRLIDENKIVEVEIKKNDLKLFKKLRMINAFMDFENVIEISIDNLVW